jgi:hypothetical protein
VKQSRRATGPRRGYSLAELLLTITMTIAVFSAAVPFFAMQMRSIQQDLGRTDAQQTARYAQNTVDRELRNVGIGVEGMQTALGIPRNQPKIVRAAALAVTFNTDLIANDTADFEAVYYDPNVAQSLTTALPVSNSITLPLSSKTYPDYTYRKEDGSIGLAETVSYWASLDSTSGQPNEYVLFRRVNDGPVTVVARGIRIASGQPLFKYTRVLASGLLDSIATASLPVVWDTPGSIADSIRSISLTVNGVFRGYNLQNKATTIVRSVTSQTSLANIGLAQRNSCGDTPLNPGTPIASVILGPPDKVQLTWTASADEAAGEKDVERYAIYRRLVGAGWDAPIDAIGKSGANYTWDDFDIHPGLSYEYGIVAQDCSPANSAMRVSSSVLHP